MQLFKFTETTLQHIFQLQSFLMQTTKFVWQEKNDIETEIYILCFGTNSEMILNVFISNVLSWLCILLSLWNLKPFLAHIFSQSPLCPRQEAVPPCSTSTMYIHEFYCWYSIKDILSVLMLTAWPCTKATVINPVSHDSVTSCESRLLVRIFNLLSRIGIDPCLIPVSPNAVISSRQLEDYNGMQKFIPFTGSLSEFAELIVWLWKDISERTWHGIPNIKYIWDRTAILNASLCLWG